MVPPSCSGSSSVASGELALASYLHPIDATLDLPLTDPAPDYYYQGRCPRTGTWQVLPRTALAKAVARTLMAQLKADGRYGQEGKMYGVMVVATTDNQLRVLRAFSGQLRGQAQVRGWVPPIPGRERVGLAEAHTLEQLAAIKARLQHLQQLPERQIYAVQVEQWDQQRQILNAHHRQRKQDRQAQRQQLRATLVGETLQRNLTALEQASRADKAELRRWKQARSHHLTPLATQIADADAEICQLKRQRQELSRQLQTTLHTVYTLTNFAGTSANLMDLALATPLPTGTGDCCAPKLLHFAATYQLKPLAMAEFWWGPPSSTGNKQPGQFYAACQERCQPIMGFLLSGLSSCAAVTTQEPEALPIIFQDQELVIVDKPAGLLSVPGRYGNRQDSVLSRLRHQLPDGESLRPVHRLDQDTSGLLVLARDATSYRNLNQQFQRRQVQKIYVALLHGQLSPATGIIELPLWGNPQERPRQSVDWQRGKPSYTEYQILSAQNSISRVEFRPVTGRTHQLRVHAAHPLGLNAPIQGDRLYGQADPDQRLCLHAQAIRFTHPRHQQPLDLQVPTPF